MANISKAVFDHKRLREKLLTQFPDLSDDEQALADTLEGESNLDQKLIALLRSADDDAMLVRGISDRVAELTERKDRLEQRVEAKKAVALWAMTEAGLPKLQAPDFTASVVAKRTSVIITDESAIPAGYLVEAAPKHDKTLIGKALKDGFAVPGCVLSNGGETLTIRKK